MKSKNLVLLSSLAVALLLGGCTPGTNDGIAPTSITISADSNVVKLGEACSLDLVVQPSNASVKDILFEVTAGHANLAISTYGVVKGIRVGTGTVRALLYTDLGVISNSLSFSITNSDTESLTILDNKEILFVSQSNQLTTAIAPLSADQKVDWTVVEGTAVSVNSNGLVVGVREGMATVRASAKDNPNLYDEVEYNVYRDNWSPVELLEFNSIMGGYTYIPRFIRLLDYNFENLNDRDSDPENAILVTARIPWSNAITEVLSYFELIASQRPTIVSQNYNPLTRVLDMELTIFVNLNLDFDLRIQHIGDNLIFKFSPHFYYGSIGATEWDPITQTLLDSEYPGLGLPYPVGFDIYSQNQVSYMTYLTMTEALDTDEMSAIYDQQMLAAGFTNHLGLIVRDIPSLEEKSIVGHYFKTKDAQNDYRVEVGVYGIYINRTEIGGYITQISVHIQPKTWDINMTRNLIPTSTLIIPEMIGIEGFIYDDGGFASGQAIMKVYGVTQSMFTDYTEDLIIKMNVPTSEPYFDWPMGDSYYVIVSSSFLVMFRLYTETDQLWITITIYDHWKVD